MPNTTVTLMRRCKTESGWKFYPVVIGKNGRIRPEYAMVDSEPTHFPVGHYELRFYAGRKLRYENVGKNAADALAARDAKEKLLAAKTAANEAGVQLPETPGRVYLRRAAGLYVEQRKDKRKLEAARYAELVTGEFIADCGKTFLDEVTKDDVTAYEKSLRKRGQSERTIANKHQRLRSFFRFAGVDVDVLMPEKPVYEKKEPTIYNPEQIGALMKACDPYMRLAVELGLKCGLREQEMIYLEWSDILWRDKVLRVQGKPTYGFAVKDKEQRSVPVPEDLLKRLNEGRPNNGQGLILATSSGSPNTHLLRQLKRLVNRAGLNCGVCGGCTGKVKECEQFTLHKLRRTYCTTLLRNGVDLKTVQKYMGHTDLASTMRYLSAATDKEMQARINRIQWGD